MTNYLTKILKQAKQLSVTFDNSNVFLDHILYALLEDEDVIEMLNHFEINTGTMKGKCIAHIKTLEKMEDIDSVISADGLDHSSRQDLDQFSMDFLRKVVAKMQSSEMIEIDGENLFILMLAEDHYIHFAPNLIWESMNSNNVSFNDMAKYISHGPNFDKEARIEDYIEEKSEMKKSMVDPNIINLNERASKGLINEVTGRESEMSQVSQTLLRKAKNNPILVGEPGVGKTAIAEGLAWNIVNKKVPKKLEDKVILMIDIPGVLSGTKYRGEFEKKIKNILSMVETNPNIVFFIDEIHTMVGAGATGGGSMDLSNILKPKLASGEISVIGATTYSEYNILQKDQALSRRFQMVDVKEPNISETIKIVTKVAQESFEKHHGITYDPTVFEYAVKLADRHIANRFFPDKALDVLDEAGAYANLHDKKMVSKNIIDLVIAKIARIPENKLNENDKEKLKNLELNLNMSIYGQENQIKEVADLMVLSKTGLRDPRKPIASLFFTGPTGVGKTQLAEQLAYHMNMKFKKFDMSNYLDKTSINQLIGSSPSYVGYADGGQLTNFLIKNPYSVIVFDEIEKAHPDVYNVCLSMMDYGTITDGQGKVVSCKNAILIFTSNVGQAEKVASIGLSINNQVPNEGKVDKKFETLFSPEFRNRLDGVIKFQALNKNDVYKVIDKNIIALESRMQDNGTKVNLRVDETAKAYLMDNGFNPKMGARFMETAIQNFLAKPLSQFLLYNYDETSDDIIFINISCKDNKMIFLLDKKVIKEKKKVKTSNC